MKVLFITSSYPLPANSGAAVAALETLRSIHQLCELHLLTPPPLTDAQTFAAALQDALPGMITHYYPSGPSQTPRHVMYRTAVKALVTGRSYWAMVWFNRNLRDAFQRLQARQRFDAVHCEWLLPALSLTGLSLPLVIRTLDVHFEAMDQFAESIPAGQRLRRWFWRKQVERFRKCETQVLGQAAAVVSISNEDAATLRQEGIAKVITLPPPRRLEVETTTRANSTCLAVFVGRLDMEVNRDAFFVFAEEVWPRLSASARENAQIVFAGGFPSDHLRQRAREIGVELRAPLSDAEASELFRTADLFFSPVRTGTGIKIKTLDAMAHGKPMVGFKGAFRGVPIESGKHALVAETPADFARLLESLFSDEALRQQIGAAGREFVQTHFDPKLLGAELVEVYQRVVEACGQQQANQVNGPIRLRPDFQD